jgi:hypothetical protein
MSNYPFPPQSEFLPWLNSLDDNHEFNLLSPNNCIFGQFLKARYPDKESDMGIWSFLVSDKKVISSRQNSPQWVMNVFESDDKMRNSSIKASEVKEIYNKLYPI